MIDISKALKLSKSIIGKSKNVVYYVDPEILDMARALIEQQATLERYKAALEIIAAPLDIIQIGEHGKQPISVDGNEWWVTKSNAMERVTAAREALEGSK